MSFFRKKTGAITFIPAMTFRAESWGEKGTTENVVGGRVRGDGGREVGREWRST